MTNWNFQMPIFRFQMAICSFKRLFGLQFAASWGVLWGPPLVWQFSLKTVLAPHKEFDQKFGAVILKDLGPKACILAFLAILGFKMFIFGFPNGQFLVPDDHKIIKFHFKMTNWSSQMTIFRSQMAICSIKRLFVLQFAASWGVLWGRPLGLAIFLENGTSAT